VEFVWLKASANLISKRQPDLLQIDEDEGITEVDATVRPEEIVHDTIAAHHPSYRISKVQQTS
jgi:hypothetical protein